jgi:hypothetical protein
MPRSREHHRVVPGAAIDRRDDLIPNGYSAVAEEQSFSLYLLVTAYGFQSVHDTRYLGELTGWFLCTFSMGVTSLVQH